MKTSSSASGTFIVFRIVMIGDKVSSQRRDGGMELKQYVGYILYHGDEDKTHQEKREKSGCSMMYCV